MYLGDATWTVTKTCPINSGYDDQWYFYEDTGRLAEKELARVQTVSAVGSSQPEEQPKEGSLNAVKESRPVEDHEFYELYYEMKGYMKQAYTVAARLQDFSWHPFDGLVWESPDKYGNEQPVLLAQVLPSADDVKPLSTQCDKCNALAVKVWLERPTTEPEATAKETTKLSLGQWRALCCQLLSELSEAKHQATKVKSDTSRQFTDIEHNLSMSTSSIQETYLDRFQGRRAQYAGLFDDVTRSLEQAERLTLKLRCWHFSSPTTPED